MASNITFNGVGFSIPAEGDSYGDDLSSYLVAISTGALQKTGGNFTLSSEVNFGNSFGVRSPYLKSQAANPAGSGVLRLGNTDGIAWRNFGNSADLTLKVTALNGLEFDGTSLSVGGDPVQTEIFVSDTSTISMTLVGSTISSELVPLSIDDSHISNSAAIAGSKLNLSNTITNADVTALAAISYSKLNLANSIQNSDINSGAAIARTKLAPLTVNRAMVTDGSGNDSVSAVTATELAYISGVTSAIQTQLNTKQDSSSAVTLTGTQTLTNKTLTSPTINTPISDVVTMDGQALTPSNPSAGFYKMYLKDSTNKLTILDSSGNETSVGSGGGGINLITNGDAEAGTTGWATYFNTPWPSPDSGTGGTANVTFTSTSTAPLYGINSFLFTKDAANRQGQGASFAFTVQPAHRAKVLNINFDYILNSGIFVPGTASDVTVWIYDVTNSTLIQPSSFNLLSNSTTIADKFSATFQTSATGSSYRLILHCGTTSASAYSLKLDNFSVSPSDYVYGTPVTNEQDYVPTFGGVGTVVLNYAKWSRVGDRIRVRALFTTGTTAGVTATMTLPYSVPMNLTPGITPVGEYWRNVSAATSRKGGVVLGQNGTNTAFFGLNEYAVAGSPFDTQFGNANFANSELVQVEFEYTAVGASSSVQMSDGYDARDVSFRVQANVTGVNPNATYVKVTVPTVIDDTIGAYSAGRYTVQTAGSYSFSAVASVGGTNVLVAIYRIAIYKNGGLYASGPFVTGQSGNGFDIFVDTGILKANVGDYFEVYFYSGGNNSTNTLTLNGARFSGFKHQAPQTISASDRISSVYKTGAAQSIPNNSVAIIDFGTREEDTHGRVTTGAAWKMTADTAGMYEIATAITFASGGGWAAGEYIELRYYKNGNFHALAGGMVMQATNNSFVIVPGSARQVQLNAGEYLDVRVYQNSGASLALEANDAYNWVSIKRVK